MNWSTRISKEKRMWNKIKKFLKNLHEWHRDAVYNFQYKLKLDDYTMWWVAFLKGVFLTLFFMWLF